MLPLPPVAAGGRLAQAMRLPRDHYVRLDSNDYSVHPAVVGRRIEVHADLDRVWVTCEGAVVADHARVWAQHQTITDFEHTVAAKLLRQGRATCCARSPTRCTGEQVEIRSLGALRPGPRPRRPTGGGRLMATRTTTRTPKTGRDVTSELEYLTRALKAPTLRESVDRLAERAREESWTHEEFLAACLQREVSARESHGGEGRIRAARFPARKSPRGLRLRPRPRPETRDHRPPGHPGLRRRQGERRAARPARHRQDPPGHRAGDPGLPGRAPGPVRHRQSQWVDRLAEAHHAGRLQDELRRLVRYPVLVIDEVGYIPFEPEAANLFFQLVSSRYERASLIVTTNKNFARWGEVFGDDTVAAAMIDRLVHHAEVIALKGDSYRLKNRDLGRVPAAVTEEN